MPCMACQWPWSCGTNIAGSMTQKPVNSATNLRSFTAKGFCSGRTCKCSNSSHTTSVHPIYKKTPAPSPNSTKFASGPAAYVIPMPIRTETGAMSENGSKTCNRRLTEYPARRYRVDRAIWVGSLWMAMAAVNSSRPLAVSYTPTTIDSSTWWTAIAVKKTNRPHGLARAAAAAD